MSRQVAGTHLKGCGSCMQYTFRLAGVFQHPLPRMARRPVIGSAECMARISRAPIGMRKPKAQPVTITRLGIDALIPFARRDALGRAAGDVSRIEVLSPTS